MLVKNETSSYLYLFYPSKTFVQLVAVIPPSHSEKLSFISSEQLYYRSGTKSHVTRHIFEVDELPQLHKLADNPKIVVEMGPKEKQLNPFSE
eukprot:TRINITY_DN1668_c0_g1_i1.p1 TRINITY_DN1668_c0_g1~~TRINITY_DN1668_c0_g1_i1.p1  ORF type:complete len:108 (-),score=27.08 TRINITY_DN1668_c0_g1_i1:131-406(-)